MEEEAHIHCFLLNVLKYCLYLVHVSPHVTPSMGFLDKLRTSGVPGWQDQAGLQLFQTHTNERKLFYIIETRRLVLAVNMRFCLFFKKVIQGKKNERQDRVCRITLCL